MPKLLEQVREQLRTRHYSYRTEQTYLYWIKQFILFHSKRHPSLLGVDEIGGFLTHLAVKRSVAAFNSNRGGKGVRSPLDQSVGLRKKE